MLYWKIIFFLIFFYFLRNITGLSKWLKYMWIFLNIFITLFWSTCAALTFIKGRKRQIHIRLFCDAPGSSSVPKPGFCLQKKNLHAMRLYLRKYRNSSSFIRKYCSKKAKKAKVTLLGCRYLLFCWWSWSFLSSGCIAVQWVGICLATALTAYFGLFTGKKKTFLPKWENNNTEVFCLSEIRK